MSRRAIRAREIDSDAAACRGPRKCILPKFHRISQISGLGFDHPEVRCRIDQSRIFGERFLVELAGVLSRSSALLVISQRRKQRRIVRVLLYSFQEQFSRLRFCRRMPLSATESQARARSRGSGSVLLSGNGTRRGREDVCLRIREQLRRDLWPPPDAMVRNFGMGHVSAGRSGHVADGAIGMIGMVLCCESRAVAGQALTSIECNAVFRRGRLVRVVAARARHSIARFLLALALRQSLHLADSAQT